MWYSFEFKVECIEMYQQGVWSDTPEGISARNFHKRILAKITTGESCEQNSELAKRKKSC